MRYFILIYVFTFFSNYLFAQIDKEPIPEPEMNLIHSQSVNSVFGRIVDLQTNKGIDAASIQLYMRITGSLSRQTKDSLIGAMLSKPNGDFLFNKIPLNQILVIKVSAIGYGPYDKTFDFGKDGNIAAVSNTQKDLGNIIMSR